MGDEEKDNGKTTAEEGAAGEGVRKFSFPGVPPAVERPSITTEEMYGIARVFGHKAFTSDEIAPKLKGAGMVLKMEYFDPENWGDVEPQVTVDTTKYPAQVHLGPCEIAPVVTLRMHAHIAHLFWMQKLNLVSAFVRGLMRARGPIPQILRLLPIIKPSYPYYREALRELGLFKLINYPDPEEPEGGSQAAAEPEIKT